MSAEFDLAEAIYAEIVADTSVAVALDLWRQRLIGDDLADMRVLLAAVAASATEAVLARRQSEAARTGPWGDYEEEDGYPGSLVPRKRDAP